MLEGITSPVEMHNFQVGSDFKRLYTAPEDRGSRSMGSLPDATFQIGRSGGAPSPCSKLARLDHISEQDFVADIEGTVKLMATLHSQHQDFCPGNLLTKSGQRKSLKVKDGDEEDLEGGLLERLEFYKMARKFDPEPLPALTPAGVTSKALWMQMTAALPKADPEREALVEYNMGPDALQSWQPEDKKLHLLHKKGRGELRTAQVINQKEQILETHCAFWSDDLERIHRQGTAALNNSKKKEISEQDKAALAQRWLAIAAVVAFAQKAHLELEAGRKLSGTLQFRPHEEASKLKVQDLIICWRARKNLRKHRRQANAIAECVTKWHKGQCLRRMAAYMKNVRKLQIWWRKMREDLHVVRDYLSRRWDALERAELGPKLALNAIPTPTPAPAASTHCSRASSSTSRKEKRASTLPMEDAEKMLEMFMIPEGKRLNFIEHELRAQRYKLLPEIKIWEDSLKKWQSDEEKGKQSRETRRATPTFFRMPPVRPSHLPIAHLRKDAKDPDVPCKPCAECSKWCEGKRGDKEIMQWKARLKASKCDEGWTEIPLSKKQEESRKQGAKEHEEKARRMKTATTQDLCSGLTLESLPNAEDPKHAENDRDQEELRKWGMGIEMMSLPGLDRRGENEETMPVVYCHGI